MRMLLALLLAIFANTPAKAAEPTWTGQWQTRWRDGGARVELVQQGSRVTGTYPAYGGRIEGEVVGRELRGRWIEGARFGGITFVMASSGQSFMGRYDTGEWWTGGRIEAGKGAAAIAVDQATPRRAMRTFLLAGNAGRDGNPNEFAVAAAVMDFGPSGAEMAPGRKLAAARALFELVDQTTFQLWSVPGRSTTSNWVEVALRQAGTDAQLLLTFVREAVDKPWLLVNPSELDLAAARRALLARSGGRLPPPDGFRQRATARDSYRSFMTGFRDWEGSGRTQVLAAMDLSEFSEATRGYEGELAAGYLQEAIDRIGTIMPQEIPDDPQSRVAYVLFTHPGGSIVLAPEPQGKAWRFDADTIRGARALYTEIEDMPEAENGTPPGISSAYMRLRRHVRDLAPVLLADLGPLEAWQALGWAVVIVASAAAGTALAWVLVAVLRRVGRGRLAAPAEQFSWPLRLLVAARTYHLMVQSLGLPEASKRISVGGEGLVMAVGIVWGGWKLLDALGAKAMRRAEASVGTMDEIVLSLLLGLARTVLLAGGIIYAAQTLSLPYEGIVAGLGISGLAVAFASKETLSNVFGAGILVADRPFRRGDWIEAGEAKGTVEHVGIRSTRIRTADDSLLFVPNGKLADATVNNLGTRRHRVAKAKLLVAHGTTPDKLDALVDGIVALAAEVPQVQPGSVQVGISSITPEGIEVEVVCKLDTRSGDEERVDKTALMVGMLRLAWRLRIALGSPEAASTPMLSTAAQ